MVSAIDLTVYPSLLFIQKSDGEEKRSEREITVEKKKGFEIPGASITLFYERSFRAGAIYEF